MITKRPIYNQQLKCVAFEILSCRNVILNEELTRQFYELIYHTDTQLPLFVPFSLKKLLEQFETPINNPIILKLSADEIESVYSLTELQDSLFSIALLINTPQQLAWLNFAEYIGLTEQLMSKSDVTKVVQYSKAKNRKIIAYDLNQHVNFEKCKAMTMDYYCGDFLLNYIAEEHTEIAANKLNVLQLIQELQKEDCDLNTITHIIQEDPLLSYQLLKLVNSVGFSSGPSIESIDQAVARLGTINLKKWVMLFSMKNISDKPIEILESGLIRAHMAEELAKKSSNIFSQSAYTAGLLSILDCLLNKPMPALVEQITLAEEIKNALTNKSGPLGNLLSLVIAYEEGHWEEVTQLNINGIDLSQLYIDSLALVSQGTKIMSN
ncbi:TPA: EAL and HDOD domain-containing protein [Legionella pneumophila]